MTLNFLIDGEDVIVYSSEKPITEEENGWGTASGVFAESIGLKRLTSISIPAELVGVDLVQFYKYSSGSFVKNPAYPSVEERVQDVVDALALELLEAVGV